MNFPVVGHVFHDQRAVVAIGTTVAFLSQHGNVEFSFVVEDKAGDQAAEVVTADFVEYCAEVGQLVFTVQVPLAAVVVVNVDLRNSSTVVERGVGCLWQVADRKCLRRGC